MLTALTISRRPNEGFTLDGDITVFITRVSGNRVTLRIEAPQETRILRTELPRVDDTNDAEAV